MNKREAARAQVRRRQLKVMAYIREAGKATTSEIIAHFGLGGGSIGGIIGQLTKHGEIISVDTGRKTRNGASIMDYYLTGNGEEMPDAGTPCAPFPLGEVFHLAAPKVPVAGVHRNYCK